MTVHNNKFVKNGKEKSPTHGINKQTIYQREKAKSAGRNNVEKTNISQELTKHKQRRQI